MIRYILFTLILFYSAVSISQLQEQEIFVLDNQDTLWGTFCNPQSKIDTTQTLVLIIAGSGPTDRNGNNSAMKNNSLKFFAHDLSKFGIASLRYDKRGVGASLNAMKPEIELTFEDNVQIAKHFYEKASTMGYHKIVVAGHSEGSLIGILLCQEKKASGFISLAGAGRPIQEVLKEQYEATAPIVRDSAHVIIDLLASGQKVDTLSPWLYSIFRPAIQPYLMSWMSYKPYDEIAKLNCPSIIIQGTTDLQVTVEDAKLLSKNLPEESLIILEDMNHIFKKVGEDKNENKASYNEPSLPLHPELIFSVISFLKQLH